MGENLSDLEKGDKSGTLSQTGESDSGKTIQKRKLERNLQPSNHGKKRK